MPKERKRNINRQWTNKHPCSLIMIKTQIITRERDFLLLFTMAKILKRIFDIQGWQGRMERNTAYGMELNYYNFFWRTLLWYLCFFDTEKKSSHNHEEICTNIFITILSIVKNSKQKFTNREEELNYDTSIIRNAMQNLINLYIVVELPVTYICKLKIIKFCFILTLWSQLC